LNGEFAKADAANRIFPDETAGAAAAFAAIVLSNFKLRCALLFYD
jgi:hypothetical protein